MAVRPGGDHRVTQDHPVRPYGFGITSQRPIDKLPIPKHAQAACQMASCRKIGHYDLLRIHGPLFIVLTDLGHQEGQLPQSHGKTGCR